MLDYKNNVFTVEKDGLTLTVEPDSHAVNPREEEYTNRMLLWGNPDFTGDQNDFVTMQDFESSAVNDTVFYKLPVLLDADTYNITHEISLTNDCRHIGYIYMTQEKADALYGPMTLDAKSRCDEKLKDCIKEYNDFVNNRIYGFTVTDADGEILEIGGDYYPQESMQDVVKEMSMYCEEEHAELFYHLLAEMQSGAVAPSLPADHKPPRQTVMAYRHSQEINGQRSKKEAVEIVDSRTENGVTTYIVQTQDGIQCTAVFNIFTNAYYASDVYGVIEKPAKQKNEAEMH